MARPRVRSRRRSLCPSSALSAAPEQLRAINSAPLGPPVERFENKGTRFFPVVYFSRGRPPNQKRGEKREHYWTYSSCPSIGSFCNCFHLLESSSPRFFVKANWGNNGSQALDSGLVPPESRLGRSLIRRAVTKIWEVQSKHANMQGVYEI